MGKNKKAKKTKKNTASTKAAKAPPPPPEERLNARQLEFVRKYFLHKNASRAYREAGYVSKSPQVEASKLLTNPNIQALLSDLEKETADLFDITREKLIDQLAAIAFGHVGHVMGWDEFDIKFIPKDELSPREMAFIESISVTDTEFGKTRKMTTLAGQRVSAIRALGEMTGLGKDPNGSGTDKASRRAAIGRIRDYLAKRSGEGR